MNVQLKQKVNQIEDNALKAGKIGYYLIHRDSVLLVKKSNDDLELKNEVENTLNGKSQYIGNFIYRVEIYTTLNYIDKPHKLVPGSVHLKIKQFYVTNNYKLDYEADFKDGAVWYSDEDILNNKFHVTDIKELVKRIHNTNRFIDNMAGVKAVKILKNKEFDDYHMKNILGTLYQ